MNAPISSCLPIESAIRAEHVDDWELEIIGRENDRRIDEELAYLIRFPHDYTAKADCDIFPMLVRIITGPEDDRIGRCRDLLDADMLRVATENASKD